MTGKGDEMVRVTVELLDRGKSERGGWTREQLALLGVSWPPSPGWRGRVVGTMIPKAVAEKLLSRSNLD